MASVNPLTKEILLKVVYYGPGLGGKTTTLQYIHRTSKPEHRGKMVSLATPVDRTLYFDFLPIRLPKVGDYTLRLQLFTVPGQVHYNATRKLVLTGSDGCVFVADSQSSRMDANIESVENLAENLAEQKIDFNSHPITFQYNKRDLENIASMEELDENLNPHAWPSLGTCALTGEGVYQGLETITKRVLRDLKRREVLIHDERSTVERMEKKITFKAEEEGLLGRVKDFSESSSQKVPATAPAPDPSEQTATYSSFMRRRSPSDVDTAPPEDHAPAPQSKDPPMRVSRTPTPAVTPAQTEPGLLDFSESDEPPAPAHAGASVSFVPLLAVGDRKHAEKIEGALARGNAAAAYEAVREALDALLDSAAKNLPGAAKEALIPLLGMEGKEYLRIIGRQRSASPMEASQTEALRAYLFLLRLSIALEESRSASL